MAERELIAAKAKVAISKAQLADTIKELQFRLKPSTLASDAWHGVKDKSSDYAGKGVHAVSDHPAAAGGAIAAIALFLLRGPLASVLTRLFGGGRDKEGQITTDLSRNEDDYDLTAPVVAKTKGAKA